MLLLASGCATTVTTFDRCATGRVIDGCDVSDLPPLIAILPPWPFPALVAEPQKAKEVPDTPAHRLLQKLGK